MRYLKTYEYFLTKPELDENDRSIVWRQDNIYIAVSPLNDVKYVVLWDSNRITRKKVGFLGLSDDIIINKGKRYRDISDVFIELEYRNKGYGKLLYEIVLKYLGDDIDGICSNLRYRVNYKQIPSIYKSLNSYIDGDYEFLDKVK